MDQPLQININMVYDYPIKHMVMAFIPLSCWYESKIRSKSKNIADNIQQSSWLPKWGQSYLPKAIGEVTQSLKRKYVSDDTKIYNDYDDDN